LGNPFEDLEHEPAVHFALDRGLRVTYCNEAWDRFARENKGSAVERPAPYGRSVLDVIAPNLRTLYASAYAFVFATGQPWIHHYECSSPSHYRLFRMTVERKDEHLVIANVLIQERRHGLERQPMSAKAALYEIRTGTVTMCSVCRRTCRNDGRTWDWVPSYQEHPPALLVHGLCDECGRNLANAQET
jgi:hypothetical protein